MSDKEGRPKNCLCRCPLIVSWTFDWKERHLSGALVNWYKKIVFFFSSLSNNRWETRYRAFNLQRKKDFLWSSWLIRLFHFWLVATEPVEVNLFVFRVRIKQYPLINFINKKKVYIGTCQDEEVERFSCCLSFFNQNISGRERNNFSNLIMSAT
jgi:hypothetical protein